MFVIFAPLFEMWFRDTFRKCRTWQRKVCRAGNCKFSTDSCKSPTKKIMCAENFIYAFKFAKTRNFSPKFCKLRQKCNNNKRFFDNFL